MTELWSQLIAAVQAGNSVAYCRLVETRGSTPQKAGAGMLVFANGSQAGTLGGGCVEAEVKRRALALLASGTAEIVTLQLDNDYGWDDGLICGGRMRVLVDPLRPGDSLDYFEHLLQLATSGGGTEVIAIDAKVSPDKVSNESSQHNLPATMSLLFDDAENLVAVRNGKGNGARTGTATVADQTLATLQHELRPIANRPQPFALHGLAFLPLLPRCRLLIVGGGHVGQALGNLAADLDFDVWVLDDRAEYITADRFPRAEKRLCGLIGPTLKQLEITPSTYCVIVTRGHNHDEEALLHLIDRGARYVGMIGSQRKIKLIFDDLLAEGISPDALSHVFAPLGIDIGSQTVSEIALSIAAELVAHRNLGTVPGRLENAWTTDEQRS